MFKVYVLFSTRFPEVPVEPFSPRNADPRIIQKSEGVGNGDRGVVPRVDTYVDHGTELPEDRMYVAAEPLPFDPFVPVLKRQKNVGVAGGKVVETGANSPAKVFGGVNAPCFPPMEAHCQRDSLGKHGVKDFGIELYERCVVLPARRIFLSP